jgi:hypothetical protein
VKPRIVSETAQRPPRHSAAQAAWDRHEQAVFDNAVGFSVAGYTGRGTRAREVYATLQAAVAAAGTQPRRCVYAFDAAGRQIVLDRALWSFWLARQAAGIGGRVYD